MKLLDTVSFAVAGILGREIIDIPCLPCLVNVLGSALGKCGLREAAHPVVSFLRTVIATGGCLRGRYGLM